MPQISNPQASSQISPDVLVSSCLCEVKLLRPWSVINDGSTFSSWFEWVSVVLRSSLIGGNWMGNVSASLEWEHSGGGKKRTGRNTHIHTLTHTQQADSSQAAATERTHTHKHTLTESLDATTWRTSLSFLGSRRVFVIRSCFCNYSLRFISSRARIPQQDLRISKLFSALRESVVLIFPARQKSSQSHARAATGEAFHLKFLHLKIWTSSSSSSSSSPSQNAETWTRVWDAWSKSWYVLLFLQHFYYSGMLFYFT